MAGVAGRVVSVDMAGRKRGRWGSEGVRWPFEGGRRADHGEGRARDACEADTSVTLISPSGCRVSRLTSQLQLFFKFSYCDYCMHVSGQVVVLVCGLVVSFILVGSCLCLEIDRRPKAGIPAAHTDGKVSSVSLSRVRSLGTG